MATIYDVAELAGVSAKTVSRVLNEDKAVKAPTRERVLAAMATLDYRLNSQARHLRLGAKTSVGVLLEDPSGGYQGRFHHALLSACMEAGRLLAVELHDVGQLDWDSVISRFVADAQVRDMVLLPPLCDFGPLKSLLKAQKVNCVLISPSAPDDSYASVAMDDRLAGREITEYLLGLGHTRIGHIIGHPDHAASMLRRLGYLEAFDARLAPRPPAHYVAQGYFSFRSGLEAAEQLLSLPDRPTAIFAGSDDMAAGACSMAHKMGLRIPEDLSVVGFDDTPIASAIWPALTTVRQPYLEMARRAIAILNSAGDRVQSRDTQVRHIVPHDIVIRDTAQALR